MKREEIAAVKYEVSKRISENIKKLLEYNGITYTKLHQELERTEIYTISKSQLYKIIYYPDKDAAPVWFLLQCHDFFGISLDAITDPDFKPENHTYKEDCEFRKLIDCGALIAKHNSEQTDKETVFNEEMDDGGKLVHNSLFIEDPENNLFTSFLQTYHCYFCPTVSGENKDAASILSGTLTLEPDRGRCKVKLKIDTKKNAYKVYEGYAVISSAVNNIHCTLRSEKIGEYCYIIFRHFHLNFAKQDCHMAAILSTSSAGSSRERYPTVLRMFLSREEIKKEHYKFLAPHLWLNYSQITISEEGLLNLRDISDEYSEIVDDLFNKTESKLMYLFKEKDVVSLAKEYLESADVVKFITELRLQSYAYHYNKVSDTVENTVRNLLLSLGYYKDSVERGEEQGDLY